MKLREVNSKSVYRGGERLSPEEATHERKVNDFLHRLWNQKQKRLMQKHPAEKKKTYRVDVLREYVAYWEKVVARDDTRKHREALAGWVMLFEEAE